jgi:hypothetical protein
VFCHPQTLRDRPARLKQLSSDNAGAEAQKNLVELFPTIETDTLVEFSQFVLPELKAHEAAILCETRHESEAIAA